MSLVKISMISDCMFANRCELPTKLSEDKRYLVFEFSPEVGVVSRISLTANGVLFVEIVSQEGIALIVDSNMDGVADVVQWVTPDAKVFTHEPNSVGWVWGQTFYINIIDDALKYAEAYHTERQLEKTINKKKLGLIET